MPRGPVGLKQRCEGIFFSLSLSFFGGVKFRLPPCWTMIWWMAHAKLTPLSSNHQDRQTNTAALKFSFDCRAKSAAFDAQNTSGWSVNRDVWMALKTDRLPLEVCHLFFPDKGWVMGWWRGREKWGEYTDWMRTGSPNSEMAMLLIPSDHEVFSLQCFFRVPVQPYRNTAARKTGVGGSNTKALMHQTNEGTSASYSAWIILRQGSRGIYETARNFSDFSLRLNW